MGRKPAPQPLALAESALLASDRSPAETSLQALSSANSFAHSKSPRSPNSVLRYGDKNGQAQSQTQTQAATAAAASGSRPALHLADLINQPLDDSQASSNHYTPLSTPAATSSNVNTQQQQQRPPQPQQPPPPQPQPQQQQQQPQPQQPQQQQSQQAQQQQPSQAQHKQYGHGRYRQNDDKASKSNFFFHFGKSSRSTERLVPSGGVAPDPREGLSSRAGDPSASSRTTKSLDPSYADHTQPNPTDLPIRSNTSQTSSEVEGTSSSKKGKPKTFGRMGRTRSKNGPNASPNPSPAPSNAALNNSYNNSGFQDGSSMRVVEQPERTYQPQGATKTATASQLEPPYNRDKMPNNRNQSGDRTQPREVVSYRDRDRDQRQQQPSFRETGGYTFFNGLKNSSSRAADMISKGLFGKTSRSGSTTEREPVVDDEHYVLKVINRPLVEQVRMTRISKRLEDSRDKTEFWMPAFPWRAIDYLNFKGTDVEGLYRVPGSGPQIKKWQRKFDEDLDVDLLAQDDLYDINIIGSMLKAWLRELPDELFPKSAQERVARECAGAEKVPQLLIDELANLSPFNYYLLFAITCHLSLLLAHSDKNKMDFRNLCICFQPCMKIDAFSFKFLVCDWRECWKGCVNEARYIEEEYRLFDLPAPAGIAPPQSQTKQQAEAAADNRQISSSDGRAAHTKKPATLETGSVASNSTVSTTLTIESQRVATPPAQSGDLRPLSPIKPLSPLGF